MDKKDQENLNATLNAAIKAWYEKHFHAAHVSGRTPISVQEKEDLHTAVAGAVNAAANMPAKPAA